MWIDGMAVLLQCFMWHCLHNTFENVHLQTLSCSLPWLTPIINLYVLKTLSAHWITVVKCLFELHFCCKKEMGTCCSYLFVHPSNCCLKRRSNSRAASSIMLHWIGSSIWYLERRVFSSIGKSMNAAMRQATLRAQLQYAHAEAC